MAAPDLFDAVRRARKLTDAVIVGVSGGKDSLATLELCRQRFARIEGYFQYFIPGLGFQERYLQYLESRYNIGILRLPHWCLSSILKGASFRPHNAAIEDMPMLKMKDIFAVARSHFGIEWIATGEKKVDSLERRSMLNLCNSVTEKGRRLFPLAEWKDGDVFSYLRLQRIPLPPDYLMWAHSFGRLHAPELIGIRDRYPEDYEKILEMFPFAEAVIKRHEFAQA